MHGARNADITQNKKGAISMKKETLRQILDMAKDEKTAAEVLEMIKNYEEKYEDGTDGTTIKLKIFKAPDGTVVTEICSLFEYRDISKMSLEELRGYYEELEDQYDELEGEEPEDDTPEHEEWEDNLVELEDEMDGVEERIAQLSN